MIPLLENEFHVIAVSTDGYDGKGTVFTTAEDSAVSVENYIKENLNGHVHLVFGESFGSATAAELFNRKNVQIDSMILSGPQYVNLGILDWFLKRYIPKYQYKFIQKLQSAKQSGKMPFILKLYTGADDAALFDEFHGLAPDISLETLQNCTDEALRLYSKIKQYKIQSNAHVSVWYGEKEPNMKKALQFLTKVYPNAENHPFIGYAHGEIVSHPDVMAEEIRKFIKKV